MRSDDVPPPQSPKQRPTWQIWAIVGGAAALIAAVGIAGIIAVTRNGTPNDQPSVAMAPAQQLRSHLPVPLKPGDVCAEVAPVEHAIATVACDWPSPHVPGTATYSLYEDNTSMLRSAMTVVRGSGGYGPACASADDFSAEGGQTQWQRDNRERGTMWCFLNQEDEPVILWTDTAPKVLAWAVAPGQDEAAQLLEWFHKEGQAELGSASPPPPAPPATSPGQPRTASPTTTGPYRGPPTTQPPTTGPVTTDPGPAPS